MNRLDQLGPVEGGGRVTGVGPATAGEQPSQVGVCGDDRVDVLGPGDLEPPQHLGEGQVGKGAPGLAQAVAEQHLPTLLPGRAVSSESRRVLPMPASPESTTMPGLSAAAVEPEQPGQPFAVFVAAHEEAASRGIQWHTANYVGVH